MAAMAERLHDFIMSKVGTNWRQDVMVKFRLDDLYWLVFLAETGIMAKAAEYKTQGGGPDACDIASLSSWTCDLEATIERAEEAVTKMIAKAKPKPPPVG